ncbi:hypothetical protein Dimus_019565 [Dionaea muscipula]
MARAPSPEGDFEILGFQKRGREREKRKAGDRAIESIEDDRGGVERQAGEEGEGEVQRGRHHRRPQEAGGGSDGYPSREDPDPEVVHHLQGPYHPQGLRGPRRHGPRALLQLIHVIYHLNSFLNSILLFKYPPPPVLIRFLFNLFIVSFCFFSLGE